eukprot:113349_1
MNSKSYCTLFTGIIALATSISFFVILVGSQRTKPFTPCAGQWGPVIYLHRGNVTYAQENTSDAVVNGAVLNGANPEIDVRVLKDGESVLFHDQSMLRTTGKDKQISEVDIAEALSTSILEEIDGHNYTFTNSIPKLETVVEAICNADKNIGIDLDTKTRVAAKAGVKAIKNSACTDTKDNVIWSTPYPGVVTTLRKELESNGMDNRISMFMPSGYYSVFGLKFFMKTRIIQRFFSGTSIVSFHKTVHDAESELIQSWVDDGWCTGIWGIGPEEVAAYKADYYVVNETPIFPDLPFGGQGNDGPPKETVYEDDSLLFYNLFVALALILLLGSIGLFYSGFRCHVRRKKEVEDEDEDEIFKEDNFASEA